VIPRPLGKVKICLSGKITSKFDIGHSRQGETLRTGEATFKPEMMRTLDVLHVHCFKGTLINHKSKINNHQSPINNHLIPQIIRTAVNVV